MEKFNVLKQAYQHLKIHRETLCCIIMKFLTECKHKDVTWPKSGGSYQARVRTGNLPVHVTYLRVWTRKFRLPSILERGITLHHWVIQLAMKPDTGDHIRTWHSRKIHSCGPTFCSRLMYWNISVTMSSTCSETAQNQPCSVSCTLLTKSHQSAWLARKYLMNMQSNEKN